MTLSVNQKTTIHQGRVFRLVKENITLPNGETFDLEVIRHPGASAVVAVPRKGFVTLLRQYRHAVGGYIWEIPAGTLNPGEPPLACAKRELGEEAGYSAADWKKIGEITPLPGYSDERIHLFLAAGLSPVDRNLDPDELLDVHEVAFDTAIEMIHDGRIQDAKTIAGLFLAREVLGAG